MSTRSLIVSSLVITTIFAGNPSTLWPRGGGGGGGHGGGGGGGGSGHGGGGGFGGHGFAGGGHPGFAGGHNWGTPGYRTWGPNSGWGPRGYGWAGRGYGWGGYGWGYPAAFGVGLGLGVGLGYGFGGGYYGYYGYPAYAYSPYGYPGYGPGYYGYDPYGYGYSAGYANGAATGRNSVPPNPNEPAPPPPGANSPAPARAPNGGAQPFVDRAEAAFRSGDYAGAIKALRHATVDDPQNALITLLLGQAFFATGEYDSAAGATQAALRQLPKEQWGVIIAHYGELYGKRADYTDQLHALENAIKEKPAEPALRFLLGYHYAYLGFVTEAVDQLDAGIKLAPRDEMARQLRNEMLEKHAKPTKPPAPLLPGLPAESEDE